MWFSRILVLLCCLTLVACTGGDNSSSAGGSARYFPDKIESVNLTKTSDIRMYVGDSLWEYIDGGAELYHTYGFAGVATADYKMGDHDLLLDLYRFDDPDGAYGLYSALRPDSTEFVLLGIEGFVTGSSVEFVKGVYLVRVIAYEESDEIAAAARALADKVADGLPGTVEPPTTFGLFPVDHAVDRTDRIVGEGFMGQSFLNWVYTQDYQVDGGTYTLFLKDDLTGEAYLAWKEAVPEKVSVATGLPFDDGHCFLTASDFYGDIVVGLKAGKLVGMLNYSEQERPFVTDWLDALAPDSSASGH